MKTSEIKLTNYLLKKGFKGRNTPIMKTSLLVPCFDDFLKLMMKYFLTYSQTSFWPRFWRFCISNNFQFTRLIYRTTIRIISLCYICFDSTMKWHPCPSSNVQSSTACYIFYYLYIWISLILHVLTIIYIYYTVKSYVFMDTNFRCWRDNAFDWIHKFTNRHLE